MSAKLELTRSYDDALAAPLTGAMAYDGRHPIAESRSFARRSQKASNEDLKEISDLTPLLIVVLGSGRAQLNIDQVGIDFSDTAYTRGREGRPDAEPHPGGPPLESEFWLRESDGTFRRLQGQLRTVRGEEGRVSRWRAFTDIDDRTRVDERPEEKSASRAALGLDNDRLQRVLDYIAANVRSDLTLEKLAEIACYSTFHFARKFTLAMGVSPQRYIASLRLEHAMEELVAGKSSLAEIALDANFSSQASFTRAFRRATGTTPNEYKRRGRTETANAQPLVRTS